jgi:hypothetical protein
LNGYTNICSFFFCIRITKNYIIDTTDASKGSQASFFSDDLKKYLKDCQNKSTEMITPKSIGIIKTFEEKVSLILLHIFIFIARIT